MESYELCNWLLSLSMFPWFIRIAVCISITLLFMNNINISNIHNIVVYGSGIWIHHVLVIYSSVDGHLEFSHFLANVNSAVTNIHIQMVISIPAFNSFH